MLDDADFNLRMIYHLKWKKNEVLINLSRKR